MGPLPAPMISLAAAWTRVHAYAPNSAMFERPTIMIIAASSGDDFTSMAA